MRNGPHKKNTNCSAKLVITIKRFTKKLVTVILVECTYTAELRSGPLGIPIVEFLGMWLS